MCPYLIQCWRRREPASSGPGRVLRTEHAGQRYSTNSRQRHIAGTRPEANVPPRCGSRRSGMKRSGEPADKPDSVLTSEGRPSVWDRRCRRPRAAYLMLGGLPVGSREPAHLLGLAPNGVYLAADVTAGAGALLPHRFTLTGTALSHGPWRSAFCCTFHASPRLGVTQRSALRSPDFPRRLSPPRPPGRLPANQRTWRRA